MAEFYGDASSFVSYCNERGYAIDGLASPSPSEEIDQALLVASVYIDGKYRGGFTGRKAGGRSQAREWPREGATDAAGNEIGITEIPIEVEEATYEAAYRQLSDPGSLMPDYVATARVVSEKVGPMETTYATTPVLAASDAYPVIGVIDTIMAPLLSSASGASNLFGETTRI